MEKRILAFFIFLLILTPLSYAQNEMSSTSQPNNKPLKLVEPAADGLYYMSNPQLKINFTLKFIPPEGWRKVEFPSIIKLLMFRPNETDITNILINFPTHKPANADFIVLYKSVNKELYGDKLLKEEIARFLDSDAYTFTTIDTLQNKKIKKWTIVFVKYDLMFDISFTAKEADFDNLLPKIKKSLETLQIILPDSVKGGA